MAPPPSHRREDPVRTASPLVVDCVNALLTSAFPLWVTPVPILIPGARAAPKSCLAGALTHDLKEECVASPQKQRASSGGGRRKGELRGSTQSPPLSLFLPRQHSYLCLAEGFPPPASSGLTPLTGPHLVPTLPASPPTDRPSGFSTPDLLLCVLSGAPHCFHTLTRRLPPSPHQGLENTLQTSSHSDLISFSP